MRQHASKRKGEAFPTASPLSFCAWSITVASARIRIPSDLNNGSHQIDYSRYGDVIWKVSEYVCNERILVCVLHPRWIGEGSPHDVAKKEAYRQYNKE